MSTGPMEAVWLPVLPSFKGFGPALAKGAAADADKAGKGIGLSLGKSIVAGVALGGAGLAATGAALYKVGEVFDDVADTIRVGTGATGDALNGLVDVAKNVGTKVPADFDKIGTVVADLNTRLGLSGTTLETVASQYLEAGRILGEEVDVTKTSAAFSAFKIEGDSVTGAMDHLFQVSQATGVGMNELADAAARNAPAMDILGFSFEETTAMIGSFDKAGLNSSALMASMSKGMVTLAKDGEEPAAAFKRVQEEITGFVSAGDDAAALELASKVFGTKGASQFIGAVKSGALNLEDMSKVAGQTGDTILGAGAETMDFAEQWMLFKNKILVWLEPMGARVFGALGELMGEVTRGVTAFGAAWKYNDGDITSSGIPGMFEHLGYWARQAFDYFNATVLPVLRQFGEYLVTNVLPVVQQFGAFLTGTLVPALMQAVRWVSDNAVMLQRIATVIGVIMIPALVRWGIASAVNGAKAAAAWVVAQTAAIRAGVVYAAQSALMVAKWVWMGAQSLLQAARMAAAWLIAMGPVGWVIAAVVGLAAIVIANWDKIRNFTVSAWTAVTSWISTTWTNIKNTVSAALAWVGAWINTKMAQIQLGWALVWGSIKNFFVGIWNGIKQTIADAIAWVANWINVKATQIRVGWEIVWARIKNTIVTVWDGIKTTISNAWNGIKSTIQTLIDFVRNNVSQAFEKAKDGIATAWNKIQEVAKKPVRFVVERVINDGLIGTFNKIPGVNISKVSLPKGFAHGGYTGDGGKYDPAGIVHKGEYVFTKEQTAALGKERLASMAHSAVRGAASNMSPMAGQPAFFGGNVSQIARHRALYMDVASGMGPWDFPGAARVWNGAAGVKVAVGRGSHQGYARPLERGGGILGYATGTNIDMSPSWMSQLSAANRRKTAAHELGHALGLPHFTGVNSIMNPYLGAQAGQPTSYDIRALQRLYPGGTGKAGSGEATNPFNGLIDMMMAKLKEAFPGGGMVIDAAGGLAKTGIGQVMKIVEDIKNGLKNLADNVFGKVKDFFGGGASSAEAPLFRDQGGILPPGLSTVLNATGGNEYVLNRRQWNDLHALATRTASQEPMGGMEVNFNGPVLGDPADIIREFKTETQRASTLNSLRRVSVG